MAGVRRLLLPAGLVAVVVLALLPLGFGRTGGTTVIERDPPVADGVNVSIDLESIEPAAHAVTALVTLFPTGSYRDGENDTFAKNLRVRSRVLKESTVFEIEAGEPVGGSYEITIPVDGDPERYPLDRFDYSYPDPRDSGEVVAAPLLAVDEIPEDGQPGPVRRVPVGAFADEPGGLAGWSDSWKLVSDGWTFKVQLDLKRSTPVIASVAVVVVLVVALAALSASVAWAAATGRRPVETTFAGWFAGMLFALIPLRSNLPGAPQVGATWLDLGVFLWVEVALLAGLCVFILSWFRYREPPDYSTLRRS
jgi:hypothetical protein